MSESVFAHLRGVQDKKCSIGINFPRSPGNAYPFQKWYMPEAWVRSRCAHVNSWLVLFYQREAEFDVVVCGVPS